MKKNANTKNDKLYSRADNLTLAISIVLLVGLELSAFLPFVQDKVYEHKYNKLIEQGYTKRDAMDQAEAQTCLTRGALVVGGVAAFSIGMAVWKTIAAIDLKRTCDEIINARGGKTR